MMTRYVLPLLALGAAVFGTISVARSQPASEPATPPEPPPSTSFSRTVAAVGLVEPAGEDVAISTPVAGLVVEVFVKAEERVEAGDPLFRLDGRDLEAELRLRQAALDVAAARLARLESAPRAEEVPAAEARVREADARLADARTQLELVESVRDPRAVRREDVLRRRHAVDAAVAEADRARADLALLRAGAWEEDLAVARAEIGSAKASVARVEADIARLTVAAPSRGAMLKVDVRPGEYAATGRLSEPLMILGVVEPLHVRVDVDEADAWRVRGGMAATASVRGNAKLRAPLSFVRFEPYVVPKRSLSGAPAERVDTRVLQAIYRLDAGVLPVFPGQQLDVFLEAAR
jgi:multidrug efflux pump subunit AcrA (membrane-fusion protein)